jgi:hypothetical protein
MLEYDCGCLVRFGSSECGIHGRTQDLGEYRGYRMTLFASISYQCLDLKLYGYRTEGALKRAISKALKLNS